MERVSSGRRSVNEETGESDRAPQATGGRRPSASERRDSFTHRVLTLQRAAGNRATAQLLSAWATQSLQRDDTGIDWDRIPGGVPWLRLRGAVRTARPTWHEPSLTAGATALGVDYGWANRDKVAEDLDDLGASFVIRYLSHATSKNLTRDEADFWDSRDVDLVVVWEDGGNRAKDGYDAGRADGHAARNQADACGKPDSAPIYFAVDFDADPKDVFDYFDGVAGAIDPERVGAYGGYRVIKGLFDSNRIAYGWQTLAWSRDYGQKGHPLQWHPDACLRQIDNAYHAGRGQTVDRDVAMTEFFGQWRPDPK